MTHVDTHISKTSINIEGDDFTYTKLLNAGGEEAVVVDDKGLEKERLDTCHRLVEVLIHPI